MKLRKLFTAGVISTLATFGVSQAASADAMFGADAGITLTLTDIIGSAPFDLSVATPDLVPDATGTTGSATPVFSDTLSGGGIGDSVTIGGTISGSSSDALPGSDSATASIIGSVVITLTNLVSAPIGDPSEEVTLLFDVATGFMAGASADPDTATTTNMAAASADIDVTSILADMGTGFFLSDGGMAPSSGMPGGSFSISLDPFAFPTQEIELFFLIDGIAASTRDRPAQTPVPEPAAWLLALSGLGLVRLAKRKPAA